MSFEFRSFLSNCIFNFVHLSVYNKHSYFLKYIYVFLPNNPLWKLIITFLINLCIRDNSELLQNIITNPYIRHLSEVIKNFLNTIISRLNLYIQLIIKKQVTRVKKNIYSKQKKFGKEKSNDFPISPSLQ